MNLRWLSSSSFRLALVYMVLFGVSVLVLLGFIYWSTAAYMARQADSTIEAEIAGLAERYEIGGVVGLSAVIAERISRQAPTTSSVYLLTDPSQRRLVGNLDRWPEEAQIDEGWMTFELHSVSGGETVHAARARAFRLHGGFQLLVGRDMRELHAAQSLIRRTLFWGLAITLVLALAGGMLMTRSLVRRLEQINTTSREIMSGDLSRRVPTRGTGDDFDALAGNLNAMLDQIESLMDGIRRVSDSIAHDLRTPLSRLRTRLEALRNEDAATTRESVEKAIDDADGLLSTFNALLRIARIESGQRRAGFACVDLVSLCRDVVELYEPLADEQGQRLSLEADTALAVTADRDLLFQAVANLLDNALKHSPPGSLICLACGLDGDQAWLRVDDNGPGIPEGERERVLQRFHRLEASRTTPGNGLGLSLVAAVAGVHGIRLTLSDNEPGLRVSLHFPARLLAPHGAVAEAEVAPPARTSDGIHATAPDPSARPTEAS